MSGNRGKLSIISGRANPAFAQAAAESIGVGLSACQLRSFSDGETSVEIEDNVRGRDVFVFQSTSTPVNEHLMELLIIIDALKRASAKRITAVLPYFGYARQDRKLKPRVPITAKLVSDLISTAGANRVLTMDLHAGQIMGFFNVPVDNLYARPIFLEELRQRYGGEKIAIVSPDAGGVARARAYAKRLDAQLAIIDKRRTGPNEIAEMNVIGDVKDVIAIIVDDMVDTGGTLLKASEALLQSGAKQVVTCCTHAVLSGQAKQNLSSDAVSGNIVSDTIAHKDLIDYDKIDVLSVAPLFGQAIKRINEEDSISRLFGS